MIAIIKYSGPPAGRIYYTLPLFDAHPKKNGTSVVGEIVLRNSGNGELPKGYGLSFQPDNYDIFGSPRFGGDGEGLTEDQIKDINELYFYMLDNPDLVEGEVKL